MGWVGWGEGRRLLQGMSRGEVKNFVSFKIGNFSKKKFKIVFGGWVGDGVEIKNNNSFYFKTK